MERAEASFRRGGFMKRLDARRKFVLACVLVALASLIVYAARGRAARGPYALADDCPRGALVYVQASDVPALLRLWDDSKFKERYLASTNFRQFSNGHIALKLAERAGEFGDALGFAPDSAALAELAEKGAAVAVYDIGRMELVFVAPASEEKIMAARLFQGAGDFEQTELPDGTAYYSREVESDRGRQKQKILFAFARGRFVLATEEKLMLRTLANVGGGSRRDRLSDEPSFKTLSAELAPHLASVWVDQTRLNSDYYFKHYWAAGVAPETARMRAGLFDFEMREGSLLERREFLVDERRKHAAALSPEDVRELSAAVPRDAVYARLRVVGGEGGALASSLVRDAVLDRVAVEETGGNRGARLHEDFDPVSEGENYSWAGDYTYLDGDYDEAIDDSSDEEGEASGNSVDSDERAAASLARVLARARPSRAAFAEGPLANEGPLFVEFRRLAVLKLDDAGSLDRRALEEALSSLVAGRLTVAGARLEWADAGAGGRGRRELALPMLGWKLCYALKGRALFVSNDETFLDSALEGSGEQSRARADSAFAPDDLTLIRLDRKAEAFDRVFSKLDARRVADYRKERGLKAEGAAEESPSEEFFSGNVSSLLDAASSVGRVEIRRRSAPGRLREEVELLTKATEAGGR